MAQHGHGQHQRPIQQDWANREYIEVITGSIKKISDFLNSFDTSCRSRLATLNEKLTQLERKVEYIEARDHPITPFGHLIHNKDDSRRKPLHVATDITQITFMAVILKLKCKYSISVEDVNELLLLFQKVVPSENILPKNITEIDRLTKDLLVQHEEHTICACEEYRFGQDRQNCEVCNQHRSMGTKYYSIPIGPRLQQLREVKSLARLTALMDCIPEKARFISDLHDTSSWSTFSKEMGKNAIALSYCSDGFNPFHHIISQGSYSIWAQSSLILNLPHQLRSKTGTTLLLGLISGPRAPKKLNKYNEVIVNELVQLKEGLATYNADSKQREVVKVGLLFMVGDVPGMAKEQNRVQQNAKTSCSHCTVNGIHSSILDKTIYPGGRRFLDINHPLRQDTTFPSGATEDEVVIKRSAEDEKAEARYLDRLLQEKIQQGKSTDTLASAFAQQTGRYGSNHWFRLGLDMQQKHAPVEPMHAIKVVAEHTIKLLNGDEDGAKVRAADRDSGRNVDLCPDAVYRIYVKEKKTLGQKRKKNAEESSILQTKYPKTELPQAPYVLTAEEKKVADRRLSDIKVPVNFGIIPATLFQKIVGGTKCHTWLQLFSSGIIRFCTRGMLGDPQRKSLVNFLLLLEEAYGTSFDMTLMDSFEQRWHEALCMVERDFPASLQTFYFHLFHHLPQYIRLYGPPRNFWMFPYERYNHTLTEAVSNNQYPELSAIKKVEVQWLITLLDSAGFFHPIKVEAQEVLKQLSAGRHKPVKRDLSDQEMVHLKEFYQTDNVIPHITIYHHATTKKGSYRDTSIEKADQREKCSMVLFDNCVGSIEFFFSNNNNELAWVKWIGFIQQDEESKCFFVIPSDNLLCPVVKLANLSPPLIHCLDQGQLWIPKLPM